MVYNATLSASFKKQIRSRFARIYDSDKASRCVKELENLLDTYGFTADANTGRSGWSHQDAILITYGDMVISEKNDTPPLQVLEYFADSYLNEFISTIHILPFFPSSSDGGFSVMDYREVRPGLGEWEDVERLAEKYRLMADLVINHASRFSDWFKNYQKDVAPGKDYFIEVEEKEQDLSSVTRPRSSPLLTTVKTTRGLRHVWTTFSDDQIDLDFSNPDVLLEFIDIFLFYYSKGISVIRLDAIAYLWKRIGTNSIHLEETHQVVKLFRDIVDFIDPDITLITETNVPFDENISYFGDEDEAHMIYQFSLPPLLLHALLTENASYLTQWIQDLPELPEHCTYFNFTSSHDGIGVRPLEGLIPDEELQYLVKSMRKRGGLVSYKTNPDGGQSPYELNITYFDAFETPGKPRSDMQIKRYLCSQIIMMTLQGVPGIYFHNLVATRNNIEGVAKSGVKRDINRKRYDIKELEQCLQDENDIAHKVFFRYKTLLQKRRRHPSFHPRGKQKPLVLGDRLFAYVRTAPNKKEEIAVLCNVTGEKITVDGKKISRLADVKIIEDVLNGESINTEEPLVLDPYQVRWLQL